MLSGYQRTPLAPWLRADTAVVKGFTLVSKPGCARITIHYVEVCSSFESDITNNYLNVLMFLWIIGHMYMFHGHLFQTSSFFFGFYQPVFVLYKYNLTYFLKDLVTEIYY